MNRLRVLFIFLIGMSVFFYLCNLDCTANTFNTENQVSKKVIRLVFEMDPAETKLAVQDGKQILFPVFRYDPRKKIEEQLKKTGFLLVSENSTNYDATLYVTHKERLRDAPIQGMEKITVVSHLSAELKDRNDVILLKDAISADYWGNISDTINTFVLKLASQVADHFGLDVSIDWISQEIGTKKTLNRIYFIDERNGWAIGVGGTILKTTDGGNIWASQRSGTEKELIDVYFVDAKEGWVVGSCGIILKTTDGGYTWNSQYKGVEELLLPYKQNYREYLVAVHFVNSKKGWVIGGYGTVLTTSDGGMSWDLQMKGAKSSSGPIYFAAGLHFLDERNGWLAGSFGPEGQWQRYGTVFKTSDGGSNWISQKKFSSGKTNEYLRSIHFVDAKEGWVVGDNGVILRTSDGGNTWNPQESGTKIWLTDLHFIDTKEGWVVGGKGTILTTSDGGMTWIKQESGTRQSLNGVHFIDERNGWVVGSKGTILKFQR